LGVILSLALACSGVAVRVVALPFLNDYQKQAVVEQANKVVNELEANLAKDRMLMQFVASDPNVVNIALGYVDTATYMTDRLNALPKQDELSWVTLYDAFGEPIADYDIRAEERAHIPEPDLAAFISAWLKDTAFAREPVLLVKKGASAFLVMAVPVLRNDYLEGVLVAGYNFEMESFFPSNSIAETALLITSDARSSLPKGAIVAALGDVDLYIALVPDPDAVETAVSALLKKSVAATAVVLVGAFGLVALLGRRVIVEPHRKLELQARELEEMAVIAQRANDSILVTDLKGKTIWVNPAFERLTGYTAEETVGKVPGQLLRGEGTDPATVKIVRDAIRNQEAVKVEIMNYKRWGESYWINLSIAPLLNNEQTCYGFVSISSDITSARLDREAIMSAKLEIEYQASHDPLTGLPNRRALDAALKKRSAKEASRVTIVRIDLDHFKSVNDTMGHKAGDFALVEVAKILKEETKAEDLAVRVGGDEFVLLLGPDTTEEGGAALSRRMLARIREPKVFENKVIRVGASFGIASTVGDLSDLEDLIIRADAALYEAKDLGRNRIRLYTEELHAAVLSRRSVAREMRRAVAQEEFVPYFQPQFDARTLQITGVETLARWQSEEFGLVLPGRFLPVAEQLSIIDEIDEIIFRKAITQIEGLISEGVNIPKVSVNVTAGRIHDPGVVETVIANRHRVPKISFEILESVLLDDQTDQFLFGLDRLREAGIQIEIDDFGSGHASIIGLMHLRPDGMKIDQRLVRPIIDDPLARGILESIVDMARLMKLEVVAEGVETPQHAAVLCEIGVDILQGYNFARPMPFAQLRQFVRAHEIKRA